MVNGVALRRANQRQDPLSVVEHGIAGGIANSADEKRAVVVIDKRVLFRDCLAKCLRAMDATREVLSFASVAEWNEAAADHPPAKIIILCNQSLNHADGDIGRDLALLSRAGANVPVVILSDAEDMDHVLGALESGARGYIPTSLTLDVAVGAMQVVVAGGTFVPANSLVGARRATQSSAGDNGHTCRMFTVRQSAVLEALRHGKPNKQIAYELNMRESTVKLHVRNIMRKLKVKNRTEAALLTSSLVDSLDGR
jgi:DNA-binding NarL/FixJ family response regulator